jgi:HSP20 family molecular chaperone IbpA
MNRVSLFSSPLLLGFEHFERTLERAAKSSSEGYPPYNIERVSDDHLRITLAVAGFSSADLSVTFEDRQLVIRGDRAEEDALVYLHRGIATRQFQRTFVLADGIEVVGADLDSGLLHVDLHRPRPEPVARAIPIRSRQNREGGEAGSIARDGVGDGGKDGRPARDKR